MIHPIPSGRLTASFTEQRPLSNPYRDHGAEDYAARIGTVIRAPEDGTLYGFAAFRDSRKDSKGERPTWDGLYIKGEDFPFKDYFYDIFGSLALLHGKSGLVHIFAHIYMNQLHNSTLFPEESWKYVEESGQARWPLHAMHTLYSPKLVKEGDRVGAVGNAGYSTGSHVHWEIHRGWTWTKYSDRPVPSEVVK